MADTRTPTEAFAVLDETGHTPDGLDCPLCFGFGAIAPEDFTAGMQALLCPLCDASGTISAPWVIPED